MEYICDATVISDGFYFPPIPLGDNVLFVDALAYLGPTPEHITSAVRNITTIIFTIFQGFPYHHVL